MFTSLRIRLSLSLWIFALIFIYTSTYIAHALPATAIGGSDKIGNACDVKEGVVGKCEIERNCPDLRLQMQNLGLTKVDVKSCGFTTYEEIICCPLPNFTSALGIFNTRNEYLDSDINVNGTKATRGNFDGGQERKAKRACSLLDKYAEPFTVPHILGGSPVSPGEYPHMAAIGYATINLQGSPYEFRCGGALIDKRFVLTAAHCINRPDSRPIVVRLGVTDFNSADQMKNVVDVPIANLYPHKNYRSLEKYDDIAIIELQRDVEYSSLVFPICLHTDSVDPPSNAVLNVTGWGATSVQTRKKSDVLLTASVKIVPLKNCSDTYQRNSFLPTQGLLPTQLCARDPNVVGDACWGDSGGPLNLIVDERLRKMQVIGIVSAGDGCAGPTPSLYTRVSEYLDFIEEIVWKDL
uniref:Serine protease persephone n=1 Tax=Ceratitis capitata TaxID=7213 RepID=W8C4A8_CERCA